MRVDASLQPSRYGCWAQMGCYGVVAGLWLCSPFALLLKTMVILLLGLGAWYVAVLQRRHAVCISVYQREDGGWQWQHSAHERWIQGQLQRVATLPWVVVLVFDCTAIKQQQRVVIWQDQVDRANWRRLRVVAAWAGQRPSLIEG
jgi:hypothetical protein